MYEFKNGLALRESHLVPLLELKFVPDDEKEEGDTEMTFEGYGAVFNNVDSYGDLIKRGAFKETLTEWRKQKRLPPMLSQHGGGIFGGSAEDMIPIGLWTAMREDDIGLKVKGTLAETDRGLEYYKLMKMKPRPAIDGLSIGYRAKKFTVGTKPDEPVRTLEKIELMELSVVTMPANGAARITGVKSLDEITERDFERFLMRDAGMSRSQALVVLNKGFKALKAMRDAGGEVKPQLDLGRVLDTLRGVNRDLQP